MSEFDQYETWSSISGFVPMLEAEQRFVVLRRALGGIGALATSLIDEATNEAVSSLDAIKNDPEASAYTVEAEMLLEDQVLAVRGELPLMLFGVFIGYQFSLLESCLAGCLETVAAIKGTEHPRAIPNPKIENFIDALKSYGVVVDWDKELWTELREWRSARNALVHRLEVLDGTTGARYVAGDPRIDEGGLLTVGRLESFVDLVEDAVQAVDLAMKVLARPTFGP